MKEFYCAPLQGFTDRYWRKAHAALCRREGLEPPRYCAPFARVEKGETRPRDLRDIAGEDVIPQAIFKDLPELRTIASAVRSAGHKRLDLNLGCPFPPQVRAGRGSALAGNPQVLGRVAEWMRSQPDITFSLKMRPGVKASDEWRQTIDIVNSMPICYVAIHPRTASRGYKGETDMETFSEMLASLAHPAIYNGNISTPDEAAELCSRYPSIKGIMVGRGILARPTLYAEFIGKSCSEAERAGAWLEIMREVSRAIADASAGEAQALMRLKPRLDYADEAVVGRKLIKSLKKSSSLDKFLNLLG